MGLLGWALVFLVVAGIAAVLGYSGAATAATGTAKLFFFVFLAMSLVLLVAGLMGAGTTMA